jgi:hypothetical protein
MSAAGERYLYKDSSQQLQGPFDLEEMRAGFAAGYLPEDLNVRLESETEFTTIKDRASSGKPFAFTTAVSSAETSSEPQNKKAKSTIQTSSEKENVDGEDEDDELVLELTDLDRKWLYKDKSGVRKFACFLKFEFSKLILSNRLYVICIQGWCVDRSLALKYEIGLSQAISHQIPSFGKKTTTNLSHYKSCKQIPPSFFKTRSFNGSTWISKAESKGRSGTMR